MSQSDYTRHPHHEFEAASREALANANLQLALGNLGDTLARRNPRCILRFSRERGAARSARPNQGRRRWRDLDRHLETLEASVRRRGGHVHFADDGVEACRLVLDIVRSRARSTWSKASR